MAKNIIILASFFIIYILGIHCLYLKSKIIIITGDALSVVNNIREICEYFTEQEFQQAKQIYELQTTKE